MNNASNLALVDSTIPTPTRTLHEIRNEIERLEQERQSLVLTPLALLETRIQGLAARAIPGLPAAGEYLEQLQNAIRSKEEAARHHERAAEIDKTLRHLRMELQLAEADEHRHAVEQANKRMEQAHDEFALAARQVIRAYRRCLRIRSDNMQISGATQKVPPSFTFNHLTSRNCGFSTSDEMGFGPIRCEKEDN